MTAEQRIIWNALAQFVENTEDALHNTEEGSPEAEQFRQDLAVARPLLEQYDTLTAAAAEETR